MPAAVASWPVTGTYLSLRAVSAEMTELASPSLADSTALILLLVCWSICS